MVYESVIIKKGNNKEFIKHMRLLVILMIVLIGMALVSCSANKGGSSSEALTTNNFIDIEIHQFIKSSNRYTDNIIHAKYNLITEKVHLDALTLNVEENPYYGDANHFSGIYKYCSKGYFFNL